MPRPEILGPIQHLDDLRLGIDKRPDREMMYRLLLKETRARTRAIYTLLRLLDAEKSQCNRLVESASRFSGEDRLPQLEYYLDDYDRSHIEAPYPLLVESGQRALRGLDLRSVRRLLLTL